jgi:hypothetical protein
VDDQGASCTAADRKGRCRRGARMYCKYGEMFSDGIDDLLANKR